MRPAMGCMRTTTFSAMPSIPPSTPACVKLAVSERKLIHRAVSWRVETAPPVIAKNHKPSKGSVSAVQADPLRGRCAVKVGGKPCVVEYETDSDLRDTERGPLLEPGAIEACLRREVLPAETEIPLTATNGDELTEDADLESVGTEDELDA